MAASTRLLSRSKTPVLTLGLAGILSIGLVSTSCSDEPSIPEAQEIDAVHYDIGVIEDPDVRELLDKMKDAANGTFLADTCEV